MRTISSRLSLIIASAAVAAGPAFADTFGPASPPGAAAGETAPAEPAAPGKSLSEKLNQSGGVIHPKEVDPAIEKPAPNAKDPNVIPPPGTSSGARRRSRSERLFRPLAGPRRPGLPRQVGNGSHAAQTWPPPIRKLRQDSEQSLLGE
jgi:hypothetical protein